MRKAVLMAILAVALSAQAYAEAPCTLKRIVQLPFEADSDSRPKIPASIEGRGTRMLVDTGGWWSLLHENLAADLKLSGRPTNLGSSVVDAAGTRLTTLVTVPKLKLGDVTFDFPFDFLLAKNFGTNVGGTLGLNVFARVDLEIDNAGQTISLFSQDHCKGAGPYWADSAVTLTYKRDQYIPISMPIVTADLDGEPIKTAFDTGSTDSFLDFGVAKRKFGITAGSIGVDPVGQMLLPGGQTVSVAQYTFKALTLSGLRFENVPIFLFESQGGDRQADLILGMNELKHLHLYFAFRDRMIHITPADARR